MFLACFACVLIPFWSLLMEFLPWCHQISRNITTNEMANVMRYSYLRSSGGRFRNPYDHGIRKNCSDFLIKGYNEDVEYIEGSSHSEEMEAMAVPMNSILQNGDTHARHSTGNSHIAINVNSKKTTSHHAHTHSSNCSHSNHGKAKNDGAPLGLGLGLGRTRSVAASWCLLLFKWSRS